MILLTISLGTAWAMTSNEQENNSGNVVGAIDKEARTHGVTGNGDQKIAEMRFDLSTIKRRIPRNVHTAELFESKSWYVPPPAPKVAAPVHVPPPQPTAPALPFTFIGRMFDGKEITLFITRNDQHYAVKEKDVLDENYRVDKIDQSEAMLTYLPTNTQQALSFNTTPAANALINASELKAVIVPGIPVLQTNPVN